jgi:hypothetical protein
VRFVWFRPWCGINIIIIINILLLNGSLYR